MARFFKVAVGLMILLAVSVGGCLYLAKTKGEAELKKFFTMVEAQSAEQLVEQLHPELKAQGDPLQIARSLKALAKLKGAFQGVGLNGMNFNVQVKTTGKTSGYQGEFQFADGTMPMELGFLDAKLRMIKVKAPADVEALAAVVRAPPADLAPYSDRATEFWKAALGNSPEVAFKMLHPNLREKVGKDGFLGMMAKIATDNQGLKSVEALETRTDGGGDAQLVVVHRVEFGSAQSTRAHVGIRFEIFDTSVLSFQLPSRLSPK